MNIKVISSEDVPEHWPGIADDVAHLLLTTNQKTPAAEVYHRLRTGDAVLVLAPEGFVVLSLEDRDCEPLSLLVWMAKAYETGHDCVAKYIDFFVDLAHKSGCKRLVTRTSFDAVGHHLESNGWSIGETEYHLEV